MSAFGATQAWSKQYIDGEVIIKLKKDSSEDKEFGPDTVKKRKKRANKKLKRMKALEKRKGMKISNKPNSLDLYHVKGEGKGVDQLMEELSQDEDVLYVEPNYIIEKAEIEGASNQKFNTIDEAVESQAVFELSHAHNTINLQQAWGIQAASTGSKPVVAIIDSGVDINHSVFRDSNAIWVNPGEIANNGIDDDANGYIDDVNGWNFAYRSNDVSDDDGHGTHVAGIALGATQDIYEANVSESIISIMPLKFLDADGFGTTADAIDAINYAIDNGADVLNNSWGGGSFSVLLNSVIGETYNNGLIFVAAAGNSASNNDVDPMYPASMDVPNIISVGSVNSADNLSFFSNYGDSSVDLGAPGENILSLSPGNRFAIMSGTSMSTPFVAGTAALMLVHAPSMLGFQAKRIILDEVDPVRSLSGLFLTSGRLNSGEAVATAASVNIDTVQPSYVVSAFASRSPSSAAEAAGGCGLVKDIYDDVLRNGKNGPKSPSGKNMGLLSLVFAIPVLLTLYIRAREEEMDPADRRQFERLAVQALAGLSIGGQTQMATATCLSFGGVKLSLADNGSEGSLTKNKVVNIKLLSPDKNSVFDANAKVAWVRNNECGLEFVGMSKDSQSSLARWFRKQS